MATTTSYGSITIVDITDIGEFSVYPKCNLPTTVIYSPDASGDAAYTPNWGTNYLIMTPVAYYAGTSVSTGVRWTWEKQEGTTGSRTEVTNVPGVTEIGANGSLTVKTNQFSNNANYSQITYFVTATYLNSTSSLGKDLVAEGQITFSKIEQGSSAKVARISGENIIKYASDGSITSPIDSNNKSYITLTGSVTQCNITGWKYKNGNSWTAYPSKSGASPATYPSGTTGATLNIYPDDTTFIADRVTVRLETNDNNTYDEFTVYKLRDGAAGTSVLTAVLTNEDQMIPANPDGSPVNITQSGATSQIKILRGGTDVTASENWSITTSADTGIGISRSATAQANDTVTVTSMSNNLAAGNVYFTAEHNNESLSKTFSLVKVKAGANASSFNIYNLYIDSLALNRSEVIGGTCTYNPTKFVASAKVTTVSPTSSDTVDFTNGKFRITESYNNNTADTVKYTSSTTESSTEYQPSAATVSRIKVELLDSSGNNVLDTQTVVITSDGQTGQQGPQGNAGKDAISILLGNEAEVFACNNNNYPLSKITLTIPFGAYKGTTRVAATVNSPTLFGITPTNTPASVSSDGSLVYEIETSQLISNASGLLNLTFTCEGATYHKVFSWTRSSAAKNGINGVTMLLFTPDGTLFDNGTGIITVEAYLQDGAVDKTNNTTWKWYQYLPNTATPPVYDYRELPTTAGTEQAPNYAYYSGKTLTVDAKAIEGYGAFKVEGVYNNGEGNKTYTQYISLTDKTDPIQVSLHSTLGTQIVNGQGAGALYVRVTRNGDEIDPIGETEVTTGTSVPSASTGTNGDHFILLNSTNKTAVLYYKDSGTWKVQPIEATYEWTFRKADNTPISDSSTLSARFGDSYNTTTNKVTGKCLYIDKTTVVNKLTADVMVTV